VFHWLGFLIPQLQATVDEVGEIFELISMLLNDAGGRQQFLRIGLDELTREAAEIVAESVPPNSRRRTRSDRAEQRGSPRERDRFFSK
jgi:hypothetical protein